MGARFPADEVKYESINMLRSIGPNQLNLRLLSDGIQQ